MNPFYYKTKQSSQFHIVKEVGMGSTHNLKADISYFFKPTFSYICMNKYKYIERRRKKMLLHL